jgi:DNA repair protein RadC
MIIRSGTKNHDVLSLADCIIREAKSLAGLLKWDASDFMRIKGIGKVKALQLTVQVEIAKRMMKDIRPGGQILDEPVKVWKHLHPDACSENVEKVWVLCLDRKNRLIRQEIVTSGTATASLVHPREVFRPAIRHGATAIILAHNHPSGDPSPSSADLVVTQKIKEAAKHIDLEFHDHVILGEKQNCPNLLGYYSFSEAGLV